MDKCTFKGKVSVVCDVAQDTSTVILNANHLEAKAVTVCKGRLDDKDAFVEDAVADVAKFEVLETHEMLVVTMIETLKKGDVVRIDIDYSGTLNDRMQGFYRVDDVDRAGHYGGACHFEATGARAAFPCFDEPSFRAKFRIAVDVEKKYEDRLSVLSNMSELKREDVDDDVTRIHFDVTPKLPTYLVCWCVVFDYKSTATKAPESDVPVRVFVPKGKEKQTEFALEIASTALDLYKDFFGVPYALPKMDLISLADFPIGAMENWGLLTFRERFILYDDSESSDSVRMDVAVVVAHEVAHQWFGNLVALDWWTDLWLKEGYATWISYLCVDRMRPEFEAWTQFLTNEFTFARDLDALENSHPIEVEVKSPAEIDEIFDSISYNKGASLIRMLHGWIGENAFRKGMKAYLEKFSYGNAKTADLWESLEKASGKPVGQVMSTWTKQKGFPVVTASLSSDGKVTLKQNCFQANGNQGLTTIWDIPLEVSCKSKECLKSLLFSKKEETVDLKDVPTGDWINLNPGSLGFFRVRYPKEMLDKFLPSIKDRSLPKNDRLNLISDQLALASSGLIPTVELIQFLETYRGEDDCLVWEAIENAVVKLRLMVQDDAECLESFNEWRRWLFQPTAEKLGWDEQGEKSHMAGKFRSLMQLNMVGAKDEATVKEGHGRFSKHVAGTQFLSGNLKLPAYAAAMQADGAKTMEKLMEMAREAKLNEEQIRVFSALGVGTSDRDLLNKVLEYGMSSSVRNMDAPVVFAAVASGSVVGRGLAWECFKAQKEEITRRYKTGGLLNRLVQCVTAYFSTLEQAEEVERYFKENPFPGAARSTLQSVEKVKLRAAWIGRDRENVKIYLKTKKY